MVAGVGEVGSRVLLGMMVVGAAGVTECRWKLRWIDSSPSDASKRNLDRAWAERAAATNRAKAVAGVGEVSGCW